MFSDVDVKKNVIITAPTELFRATEGAYEIFEHSPKFIPLPSKCCHNDVIRSVNDFLRRYKWRFFRFSNTKPCRFAYKSNREPPDSLVPVHVLKTCHSIRSALFSILSDCKKCFPDCDNLSHHARTELDYLR